MTWGKRDYPGRRSHLHRSIREESECGSDRMEGT
jgi:hypothetical protein